MASGTIGAAGGPRPGKPRPGWPRRRGPKDIGPGGRRAGHVAYTLELERSAGRKLMRADLGQPLPADPDVAAPLEAQVGGPGASAPGREWSQESWVRGCPWGLGEPVFSWTGIGRGQ